MALEKWLAETERHGSDLAARLGLTRAAVSAYVKGIRVPYLNTARALQRMSKGRVALADWRTPAE